MRLAALLLLAGSAALAAVPDFSGTWKLNGPKSNFGMVPAPSGLTIKIAHAEPNLALEARMTTDTGDIQFTMRYTTDGKPCTNPGVNGGPELKSTARWDGAVLLLTTESSNDGAAYTMKDKWSLSADGKVLTLLRNYSRAEGQFDQAIVFEKAAPDLGGTWKLNGAKSDFGQFPPPSGWTQKIVHAEPKLDVDNTMSSDMGEMNFAAHYTTDGKESTNAGFGGSEMKSTVKWDGETLLMETKGAFGDNPFTMKDRWNVSGKALTIQRTFSSSMGEVQQKLVFDKQ